MKTKAILKLQIDLLTVMLEVHPNPLEYIILESVIETLKGLEPEEPTFQTAKVALENFGVTADAIRDIARQQGAPIQHVSIFKINGTKEIEIAALPGYDSKLTHFIQNDTLFIKWRTN